MTKKIFSYSAPGKTILSGEHSVVYSKNALVMAIDLRTFCKVELFEDEEGHMPSEYFFSVTNLQDTPTFLGAVSLQK